MKKQTMCNLIVLAVLVSMIATVQGAPQVPRLILPIVVSPLTVPQLTTVLECRCGFSNSVVGPDNRIYTIAQRYDLGGKLYVYVFDGTKLREVADPGMTGPIPTNDNTPAFGLPVQKNGPGSIFFTSQPNAEMIVIAPARPIGVVEGDYNLMMYRVLLSDLHQ